jgi:ADP-ribose pyrophosphatase YjhB (NUDIX family)
MGSGSILLIRKKDKDLWELPGGPVRTTHDIELAAITKTKEQIGVEPTVVQQFTVFEYQKNDINIEASIFECIVDEDAAFTPGEDVEEVKWFSIADAKKANIGDDVKAVLEENG